MESVPLPFFVGDKTRTLNVERRTLNSERKPANGEFVK
jgi:hypothetical protein